MSAWVVLRHDLPDGSWHFDWMLERPGEPEGPLVTFRAEPWVGWPPAQDFVAERLADHRRAYLTYEGEVSGGRGWVRRVAEGEADVRVGDDEIEIRVSGGSVIRGRRQGVSAVWQFEVAGA